MPLANCTVLLPCHSLEDFPSWSVGEEASTLLAAWTAAWHPLLLAAVGRLPEWASIDSPPEPVADSLLIVPAAHDDRLHGGGFSFSGVAGVDRSGGGAVVRRLATRREIVAAAAETVAQGAAADAIPLVDDFHALGLAWLWSELLARRMRSTSGVDKTDFPRRAVEAARLAVEGREEETREAIRECFGVLEASRKRYYPVDIWLVDLVLLADSTPAPALAGELDSASPSGFVASGSVIAALATHCRDELRTLGSRIGAGLATGCGGMWDDHPLGLMTPEAMRESFERGMASWQRHVGASPAVFARRAGVGSAMIAQLLDSLGYAGAIWQSFDGSRTPATGGSRLRWEACRGRTVEVLTRPAADARAPATGVSLHDTLGDVLDHDHAAILPFARYPGTAADWFGDLRRIGTWSDVFGRFIAPQAVFVETAAAAARLDLGPDRFPDEPPKLRGHQPEDAPLDAAILTIRGQAEALRESETRRLDVMADVTVASVDGSAVIESDGTSMSSTPRRAGTSAAPRNNEAASPPRRGRMRWWGGSRQRPWKAGDVLPLDNGWIRVEIHPQSGGILAVRRGASQANRLSQRLSLRTTRPVTGRWEDPLDRSDYASMVADSVEPDESSADTNAGSPGTAANDGRFLAAVARGRLLAGDARPLGGFVQRVRLVPGLPLAEIDIEIDLTEPIPPFEAGRDATAWFERYAACRFAWNENDPFDLYRGLHTQAVEIERTIFTSPYFLELREGGGGAPDGSRWSRDEGGRVTILPLGLPWHVRSSPHMLDTLLMAGGDRSCRRRLAVGLGIERPWEVAAGLLTAGETPASAESVMFVRNGSHPLLEVDPPARLTGGEPVVEAGQTVGLRVGVLATGTHAARPRLRSSVTFDEAHVIDALGRRLRSLDPEMEASGGSTVAVPVERHEWVFVELRWRRPERSPHDPVDLTNPERAR